MPSSSEKAAKEITLREVKSLEKELRLLIPELIVQKNPGTHTDYLFLHGNYFGMQSIGKVRYVSNIPGVKVCEIFLKYLKQRNEWDTKSPRGECDNRQIHGYLFSSIDARKTYLENSRQRFYVDIGIHDYGTQKIDPHHSNTQIEVWIHRTLDREKSDACVVEHTPEEQPCRHGNWSERAVTQ